MARKISPALLRYLRRFAFFMTLYVGVLAPVAWAHGHGHWPQEPWNYIAAILPALPTFGAIWAILAYASEEPDEYYRSLLLRTQILALGLTLSVCTAWNFLSNYTGLLPDRIWVFPVYAICLIPAQAWTAWRAR